MSPLVATIIAGTLFVSATVAHVSFNHHPKILSILSKILLVLYVAAMFAFTISSVSLASEIGVEFNFDGNWFVKAFSPELLTSKTDFLINIAMMYPVGYACSSITKSSKASSKIVSSVIASFIISFCIEFMQFALPVDRFPSLSDIVFNTASGAIGSLSYIGVSKIISKVNFNQELNRIKQKDRTNQQDKINTLNLSNNSNKTINKDNQTVKISKLKNQKHEIQKEITALEKIKNKNEKIIDKEKNAS